MTCTGLQINLVISDYVSGVSCEKKRAIYQVKQTAQEGLLYQKEMNIFTMYYYTTKGDL
jgi:hypothetical protein